MKGFWVRLKRCLLTDDELDSTMNLQDRVAALEAYVKDLKWAVEKAGYNPKKHGYPPK